MKTIGFIATQMIVLAVLLANVGSVSAGELSGILRNNAGVGKLTGQKAGEALTEFTGALAEIPFSAQVHLNIGNTFLLRQEFDRALSEYAEALKNFKGATRGVSTGGFGQEKEVRFRALFNSAVAETELKKTDEALAHYQSALEIKPDSIETKTNMELLAKTASGQGGDENEKDKKDKDDKGKSDPDKGKGQKKAKNDNEGDKDGDKEQNKKKDQDQNQKKQKPEEFKNPHSTPRPFQSGELSDQDVKRILEEMKRQEGQIRSRMQNEKVKDQSSEKDW